MADEEHEETPPEPPAPPEPPPIPEPPRYEPPAPPDPPPSPPPMSTPPSFTPPGGEPEPPASPPPSFTPPGGTPPPDPPPDVGGAPPPPPGGPPPPTWGAPTAPPSYGAPGVPPVGYGTAPNNGKAIASLVVGIASIVLACCCSPLGVIAGIVGAVLGNQAKGEIQASGGRQGGLGQAQAGFVISLVAIGLGILLFIAGFAFDAVDYNYEFNTG